MNSEHAGYTQEKASKPPAYHKWVKLAIAVWVVRMGMMGVGFVIPVLVGLIASVPRSRPLFIPDTIIDTRSWEAPTPDRIKHLTSGSVPIIVTGAPLPQPHSLELLLQAWLPADLEHVKMSDTPLFTYLDPDAPWGAYDRRTKGVVGGDDSTGTARTLQGVKTNCFLEHIRGVNDTKDCGEQEYLQYLYKTEVLGGDRPSSSPLLQSIAPYMAQFDPDHHREQKHASRAFLWMASRDVQVGTHYDVDHNYLLQLAGTKRVVMSTPAAYDLYRPGSSLSPRWRQSGAPAALAPQGEFHSTQRVKEAISNCYASITDSTVDALCLGDPNNTQQLFHPSSMISWEVLLTPGDLLYIPPGYFHSVLYTSDSSLSLNVFVNSIVYDTLQKLRTVTSLPYSAVITDYVGADRDDRSSIASFAVQSEIGQLAGIGALVRYVLKYYLSHADSELELFGARMITRYEAEWLRLPQTDLSQSPASCALDSEETCQGGEDENGLPKRPRNATMYQCTRDHKTRADQTKKVKVAGEQVIAHLQQVAEKTHSLELAYIVLMDYVEELLHQQVKGSSLGADVVTGVSPGTELQVVKQFLDTCL